MNRNHWSAYSEQELAQMRSGGVIHASRPSRGVTQRKGPVPHAQVPDVTADAKRVLDSIRQPEPAYPAEWLPEVKAEVKAAQTPGEWLNDHRPDTITQRNGTAPHDAPAADAYPRDWLTPGDTNPGVMGGEGFLVDKRRDAALRVALTPTNLHVTCVVTFDSAAGESDQPYRIDWGDGTGIQAVAGGTSSTSHDYTKAGHYKVAVRANDVGSTQGLRVGAPAYPAWDATKVRDKQKGATEDARVVLGTKGLVG